ncbi:hypothetical protein IU450_36130 [Nocardia abscessus]|uniref:helix-turn-helix domain-containing protein n=1 Tax=Nocardia abscessus TaxID=120957 RepID=UPI001893C2A9|nr:helix-turn-helix domain-containing protein [Nocardia abscessus]MBF6341271.1 hypothetical protein [Nocardia abscessus]
MERHAVARERLARIDAADRQFTNAWESIMVAEESLAQEIAALQQRIENARARTATLIDGHRRQQAEAAAAIRREGCSVNEVADILDISPKEVRQLIAEARLPTDFDSTAAGGHHSSDVSVQPTEVGGAAADQDALAQGAPRKPRQAIEPRFDPPETYTSDEAGGS